MDKRQNLDTQPPPPRLTAASSGQTVSSTGFPTKASISQVSPSKTSVSSSASKVANSIKTTSTKASSVNESSGKATSAESTLIETSSVKATSSKATSSKATSSKATSVRTTSVKTTSVKNTSVKITPAKSTSVKTTSVKATSHKAASSAKATPSEAKATQPKTSKAATAKTNGKGGNRRRDQALTVRPAADVAPTRLHSRDWTLSKRVAIVDGAVGYAGPNDQISAVGLIMCTAIIARDSTGKKVLAHVFPKIAGSPNFDFDEFKNKPTWRQQWATFQQQIDDNGLDKQNLNFYVYAPGTKATGEEDYDVVKTSLVHLINQDYIGLSPNNKLFLAYRNDDVTDDNQSQVATIYVDGTLQTVAGSDIPQFGGEWMRSAWNRQTGSSVGPPVVVNGRGLVSTKANWATQISRQS